MEQEIFLRRQSNIMEAFNSRRFLEAVYLCSTLRKELEELSTPQLQPDSTQLGWVKSYQFQAAVKSGDLAGAYDLYHHDEPFIISFPQGTKRAMDREMRQICANLQKPQELLDFGRRELARLKSSEPDLSTCKMALEQCDFFRQLDCDELNFEFALTLLKQSCGENDFQSRGFSFLLRNFEKTMSESIAGMLLDYLPTYLEDMNKQQKLEDAQLNFDRLETILTSDYYIRRSEKNSVQLIKSEGAIREGNPEKLRESILQGSPLNTKQKQERISLLSMAIEQGAEECVALLIDYRSDIHGSCGKWRSPLHKASALGRIKTCSLLLQKGAALHCTDENFHDPLNHAVIADNPHLVRIFLKAGSHPDSALAFERNPRISLTYENDSSKLLRLLIQSGANPFEDLPDGEYQMVEAVRANAFRCLEEFLKWNPMPAEVNAALQEALRSGHEKCLNVLNNRYRN